MTLRRWALIGAAVLALLFLWSGGWMAGSADLLQGERALEEGEPTVAASYFAAADKSSGGNAMMIEQIAGAYGARGRKDETIRWLDRLVTVQPTLANRENAAIVKTQLGKLDEGCRELSDLYPSFKDDPMIVNDYAYVCMVDPGKDLDRAIVLLQTSVDRAQRNGSIVDSLGWAYIQQFRRRRNAEDLRTGTGLLEEAVVTTPPADPTLTPIREHLIAAYSLSDAPNVVNRSLAGQWVIEDSLGAAWVAIRRRPGVHESLDSAIALLEDAVQQRTDDAEERMHLGEAYRDAGRIRDAVVEIRKAAALDPTLGEAAVELRRLGGAA